MGSECAEVGSWDRAAGGRAEGRNEAAQLGQWLGQVRQAALTPTGQVTRQVSVFPWPLTPLSWKELLPAPAGACRNLRKLGMVKVQTAPALASALLAQSLPSLPARVRPHLHLASVEVRATTPFLA